MKFDKFLQTTYLYLSNGLTEGDFVQSLLINFVEDAVPNNKPPYNLDASTLRAYFSGNRKASRTARWILGYADEEKFMSYLKNYSIDALKNTSTKLAILENELPSNDYEEYILGKLINALEFASMTRPGRKTNKIQAQFLLEDELRKLIKALSESKDLVLFSELEYKAVRVNKKIKAYEDNDCTEALIKYIESNVVKYYKFIEAQLHLSDAANTSCSQEVCAAVKGKYLLLREQKSKASYVYYGVRNWIMSQAQSQEELAAEILTAFFIQNCEVFDVPSK